MDYSKILEAAQGYQKDMTAFLRDMIRIPSESCEEELVIKRIAEEMEKVGFDKVQIDAQGNCLGWMGHGPSVSIRYRSMLRATASAGWVTDQGSLPSTAILIQ